MIDEKKLINYIKAEINPYGRPFEGTVFEFGCKVMEHIEKMDKVGEWIPVEERLPEDGKDVLITDTNKIVRKIKFNMWLYEHPQYSHNIVPVAWMPLPAPYDMRKE